MWTAKSPKDRQEEAGGAARALGTSGTEALVGGRCGVPLGRTPHRISRSMAAMRNANNTDGQGPGVRQRQRECPAQGWPRRGGASESYLDSLPTSVPTICTTQLCLRSRRPP